MALTYDIKINGVRVDATIGVAVHDKLEEAMDEGALNLPITTYDYPYKMLGLLEVNISDGTNPDIDYQLLVISDLITIASKDGFYEHSLTVLEYTHKLDKMFISALTFTQPFYRNSRAPFEFLAERTDSGNIVVDALFPKVEFKETYFLGETFTLDSVGQARVLESTISSVDSLEDVFVWSDNPGNTTKKNLTASNQSFTIGGAKGIYSFYVGFYNNVTSSYEVVFKHYIRVIEDRRYTLWDMLQRVRAVLPIERESFFNDTRIFDVDSSLQASFEQIEMPQMFFRQQSARQILNTIFKYINAITRLQYVDGSNDKLTVDFFNKIGLSFDSDDIVEFNNIQNAQNYGTRAIAFLGQTLQSNFRENPSVQTPAYDKYKTVRSSNVQLTRDGFELKLEKPIYEITKISVVIPSVTFFAQNNADENIQKTIDAVELDLTPRFLEKTFWDLKSSTVDFIGYSEIEPFSLNVGMRTNKNGNLFWERNSNRIRFDLQIGETLKEVLIDTAIKEMLHEELTLNAWSDYIWKSNLDDGHTYGSFELFFKNVVVTNSLGVLSESQFYRNYKFNIEYITLEDTVVQVDRQDISENNYDAYLRINSLEAISNFQRTARDMFGKLERSAVPVKTIAKVHTDLSNVLSVGQIDSDGFIITERRLVLHNEFIEGIYTATKDHNRLNEFNGINQAFRAFEIPTYGESVKRKDFYTDYVFITNPSDTTNFTDANNETIFDETSFTDNLFAQLRNVNLRRKATFAMIKTDGFDSVYPSVVGNYKAIMTPIISFGGKGGLNFTFDFDSNQIAGVSLFKSDDNNIYNQPVRYTDEQGFFDKLWFGIGYDYRSTNDVSLPNIGDSDEDYFNEEYSYPLIQSTSSTLGQTFMIKNGLASSPDWFNIYKDAATSYGFAYHLSVIPEDYSEYVIGQSFYTENPLVYYTDTPKTLKLYVYPTLTTYNKFDDLKIKSGWSNSYNLSASVLGYSSGVFSFLGSYSQYVGSNANWAIGDEDENLYLACNTNHNGWKAYSRHLHPNLIQIGNK